MIELDSILVRAEDVRFRAVEDETVVVRQEAAEALVLNEVAGRILDLIDGERTLAAVIDVLETEFEADPEVLSRDVREYAAELVEIGVAARR